MSSSVSHHAMRRGCAAWAFVIAGLIAGGCSQRAPETRSIPAESVNERSGEEPGASVSGIRVSRPLPNAVVGRELEIRGQAQSSWFFEGTFPVAVVVEGRSAALARGSARALEEWTGGGWVPFAATLSVPGQPHRMPAAVVLSRDNPSGLPENDGELRVPIQLEASAADVAIERRFENKLVYGTQRLEAASVESLRRDCERRGGRFDDCGSPCPPGADFCIEVCAYTCALEAR